MQITLRVMAGNAGNVYNQRGNNGKSKYIYMGWNVARNHPHYPQIANVRTATRDSQSVRWPRRSRQPSG